MIELPFELNAKAILRVTEPTHGTESVIDVEEAYAVLVKAQLQPTDDERWKMVGDYLSSKFQIAVEFSRNQVIDLNNAVIAVANVLYEDRKKKIADCVSLLTTSLESPKESYSVPSQCKMHGLPTFPTS